jgi:hypothetical protein
VLSAIRAGDAVMVKGSLGSRMAPIVKALQRLSVRQDGSETVGSETVGSETDKSGTGTSGTGTSGTDASETDASATDTLQAAPAQG